MVEYCEVTTQPDVCAFDAQGCRRQSAQHWLEMAHPRGRLLPRCEHLLRLQQLEREADERERKTARTLDKRHARAQSQRAKAQRQLDLEAAVAAQKERQRDEKRQKTRDGLRFEGAQHEKKIADRLDKQFDHVRQVQMERDYKEKLKGEQNRLTAHEHQSSVRRLHMAQDITGEYIAAKHENLDQRYRALKHAKERELEQRRAASLQSSLMRQAIIIGSKNEWVETLRWTPPPGIEELLAQSAKLGSP